MPEPPTPPQSGSTTGEPTEREELETILLENIRMLDAQTDEFELDDPDDVELLNKLVRTLGYLTGQYRKLKKDADLDDMHETVEFLEALTEADDA